MWQLIVIFIFAYLFVALMPTDKSKKEVDSDDKKNDGNKRQSNSRVFDVDNFEDYGIAFELKGLYYRSAKAIEAARSLKIGDELYLERDVDNRYDGFAIKVLTEDGKHIGYVDRQFSFEVHYRLCYVTEVKVIGIRRTKIPYIDILISLSTGKEEKQDNSLITDSVNENAVE